MEIQKAHWDVDGGHVSVHMPLSKVDTENRLVSGFASLDNEDQQGDVVETSASREAFSEFRGNIREMHQPIAVGKMINFTEDRFYDEKSEKFYTGIWVTVKVSKGAQDTWEKVLDGTLSGFSIGGSVLESEPRVIKSADKMKSVNVIKKYKLTELSLVDSPANQFANVFSINKSNEASGMIVDTIFENVFFCEADAIAKSADAESMQCNMCDHDMKVIGHIEKDSDSKISDVIRKYKGGVVKMSEPVHEAEKVITTETLKVEETAVEETPAEEVVVEEVAVEETPEEVTEEPKVEEVAVVEEVGSTDLEEAVKSLNLRTGDLVKAAEENGESFEGFKKALEDVKSEVTELKTSQESINKALGDVKENLAGIEQRVEKADSNTAMKKSVSHETEPSKSTSSLWDGSPMSIRKH